MSKTIIHCKGVAIRADEVSFALANTGDTSEVFLKCGKSIIVKMPIAEFELAWENAIKSEKGGAE